MILKVNEDIAEAAVLGGAFLGGGGGGDFKLGLSHARLALSLGEIRLIDIDSLPEDGYLVTASMVGAPAAKEKLVLPSHMLKSFQILKESFKGEITGIVSSENGGYSTINGWIVSALTGIPIVDAPADGRAHPTGIMGAMGLHRLKDFVSLQSAVGGSEEEGRYIEILVKGNLIRASRMVREAAVQAGGLVAVTRNPVKRNYVKENGAIGAMTQAIEIGGFMKKYKGETYKLSEKIIEYLGNGKIVDKVRIMEVSLKTEGGFDVGKVIAQGEKDRYEVTFWNEFMTLESSDGERLATFPDLISLIEMEESIPLTSAEIKENMEALLLAIPKESIILGAGVKDPEVLREVEKITGKKILGGESVC
ncbi:MAG: uncharacterized protein PWQ16_845 [bacterium]|nr:uncharacterized protein [bacterium]